MSLKLRAVALVFAGVWAFAASAQDRIAVLRARLAHESSAVGKAKIMPPLGDAEFAQIDRDIMQEKIPEALELLKSYRDEVEACDKALDATGADAEKHPGGFKQLQFSVRDSLRRLDAVIVNLTGDDQPPFLDIRKELGDLNRHLIEHLFPRGLTDGAEHR